MTQPRTGQSRVQQLEEQIRKWRTALTERDRVLTAAYEAIAGLKAELKDRDARIDELAQRVEEQAARINALLEEELTAVVRIQAAGEPPEMPINPAVGTGADGDSVAKGSGKRPPQRRRFWQLGSAVGGG